MTSETWNCVKFVWVSDIREESGAQQVAHEVPKIDPKRVPRSTGRGNLMGSFSGHFGVLGES